MDAAQTWPGIVLIICLLRQAIATVPFPRAPHIKRTHAPVTFARMNACLSYALADVHCLQKFRRAAAPSPAVAVLSLENSELKSQLQVRQNAIGV